MYALLEQLTLQAAFPLAVLCETLEVSRAGYYAWQSESQSAQEQRDRELTPLVCDIFWKHKRRYGARRIAVELGALGQPCGVDRVAKLLKIQGLRAIQPQSYKPKTTNSQHTLGYSPNLLLKMPPPTNLNRVWVADITYIPLQSGFAFLALVLDRCSRRVVGWSLADHMTETLVLDALQHAISDRQPGAQPGSPLLRQTSYGLLQSMRRIAIKPRSSTLDHVCRSEGVDKQQVSLRIESIPPYRQLTAKATELENEGLSDLAIAAALTVGIDTVRAALGKPLPPSKVKPRPKRKRANAGGKRRIAVYKQISPAVVRLRDEEQKTFAAISKTLGVAKATAVRAYDAGRPDLIQAAVDNGEPPRRSSRSRMGRKKLELLQAMLAAKAKTKDIVAKVGCSRNTVARARRAYDRLIA